MGVVKGLKSTVYFDDGNALILKNTYKKFRFTDIKYYKEKFEELKIDDIFIDCEFEDNIWYRPNLENSRISLSFPFEYCNHVNHINDALKAYVILKVCEGSISSSFLQHLTVFTASAIVKSNFFKLDYYKDYVEELNTFAQSEKNHIYIHAKEFCSFYEINDSDFYFENTPKTEKLESRTLPTYYSIITFDSKINEFWQSASKEEKKVYYPLYVWWKLTNIIPMRTVEFTQLPIDCCRYDEISNRYFLKVKRVKIKKNKSTTNTIPILPEIEISKEIYDLLKKYEELAEHENRKFFWSYLTYRKNIVPIGPSRPSLDRIGRGSVSDKNLITRSILYRLITKFYIEILNGKLGLKICEKGASSCEDAIELFDLGDTRHFAFTRMLMQGVNPLSIAQLGGHINLKSQRSYFNSMHTFFQSHVISLSRKMRNRLNEKQGYDINDLFTDWERFNKMTPVKKNYEPVLIEGGYCLEEGWHTLGRPKCPTLTDCLFCNYSQYDLFNSAVEAKVVEEWSRRMDEKIEQQILLLQNLNKALEVDLTTLSFNNNDENKLREASAVLERYTYRKAMLEAYLQKSKEV